MSDPAIAAAQRAWLARGAIGWGDPNAACISGAREALAPIRNLHTEWLARVAHYEKNVTSARSYESAVSQGRFRDLCQRMADELAPLIYPEEEL